MNPVGVNRGSLFRLINKAANGEMLDLKRRLRMALDVVRITSCSFYTRQTPEMSLISLRPVCAMQAKGINYLHCLNPPIVHWDLKTPNMLVDKNWSVKVSPPPR